MTHDARLLRPDSSAVYGDALRAMAGAGVDFLVGGGFALQQYVGRRRPTKDLDVFLRARSVEPALASLREAGFRTEITNPEWLAKGRREGALVDLIFCSYNGLFPVDESWFVEARRAKVMGLELSLVAPEEMIVSKAFVAARDRFDGSDISWLIREHGPSLDWPRIEARMAPHWEVLLWQLVHYLYVFPTQRSNVPAPLVQRLLRRLSRQLAEGREPPDVPECRGWMLDQIHYRRFPREPNERGEPPATQPMEDALVENGR